MPIEIMLRNTRKHRLGVLASPLYPLSGSASLRGIRTDLSKPVGIKLALSQRNRYELAGLRNKRRAAI